MGGGRKNKGARYKEWKDSDLGDKPDKPPKKGRKGRKKQDSPMSESSENERVSDKAESTRGKLSDSENNLDNEFEDVDVDEKLNISLGSIDSAELDSMFPEDVEGLSEKKIEEVLAQELAKQEEEQAKLLAAQKQQERERQEREREAERRRDEEQRAREKEEKRKRLLAKLRVLKDAQRKTKQLQAATAELKKSPELRGKHQFTQEDLLESLRKLNEGKTLAFAELMSRTRAPRSPSAPEPRSVQSEPMSEIFKRIPRGDTVPNLNRIWHEFSSQGDKPGFSVGGPSTSAAGQEEGRGRSTTKEPAKAKKARRDESSDDSSSSSSSSSGDDSRRHKRGKREKKSGKLAKPEKSKIKKTVTFPHELLQRKYVDERVFDKLPFHFLCAGELETVLGLLDKDGPAMRGRTLAQVMTRLRVLMTLCYYQGNVPLADLRGQYEAVMQQIEKGHKSWDQWAVLQAELESNLNFRYMRAQSSATTSADKDKSDKRVEKDKEVKVFYCNEFNRGQCDEADPHKGLVNGKTETKFHICKTCWKKSKKQMKHKAGDAVCPFVGKE